MMSCHDKFQCLLLCTNVEIKYEILCHEALRAFVKMLLQTSICHSVL